MTNKTNNAWKAPQLRTVRSVDVSAVVYKPVVKSNPYLRPSSYRKQKSVSLRGTNAEVY